MSTFFQCLSDALHPLDPHTVLVYVHCGQDKAHNWPGVAVRLRGHYSVGHGQWSKSITENMLARAWPWLLVFPFEWPEWWTMVSVRGQVIMLA